MAESISEPVANGTEPTSLDVEMKEETLAEETPLDRIQQASDITDPLPPPQSQPQTMSAVPEHLSTIVPGATPPAASASSARPGSLPPQPSTMPQKPVAHGGPTRQYLNQNVTPHLLEAMKYLAVYEPEKPLMWLSEFLRDRSKEVEG